MILRNIKQLERKNAPIISLALAKAQLNIDLDDDSDNELLTEMVLDTQEEAENYTGFALSEATFQGTLAKWPIHGRELYLPKPPLVAVTSVKYYQSSDNTLKVLDSSNYTVIIDTFPGMILFNEGVTFPELVDRKDAVIIEFKAGYRIGEVPRPILKALRKMIFDDYEYRNNRVKEKPSISEYLLGQFNGLELPETYQ